VWGVILEYMPRPSVTEVKAEMDTHIALTNERWKETILRIKRLEAILIGTAGTTILLLLSIVIK
tara:strand:- start:597 stop:788 length:192 start_codon:yes stop_codon:yes gene_type:complete